MKRTGLNLLTILTIFLLSSQNSFSQKEFLRIDNSIKSKIEYDNKDKIDIQKTKIFEVYEIELEQSISDSELISLQTLLSSSADIVHMEYKEHSKFIYFYQDYKTGNENIKNFLYSNSLNFVDYKITYALEK